MSFLRCWTRLSDNQAENINKSRANGILFKVDPSRDRPDLTRVAELLKPLCLPRKRNLKDEVMWWKNGELCSFEIVSKDRNLDFYVWSNFREQAYRFTNVLSAVYPNARMVEVSEPIIKVEPGDYVSGGLLEPPLMDSLKEITEFKSDPLNFLIESLSHVKSTCYVQSIFKPIDTSWVVREQLKRIKDIEKYNLREPRFEAAVRFCSVSKYPLTAYNNVKTISNYFKFIFKSAGKVKLARTLPIVNPSRLLNDMLRRKYPILLDSRFYVKPETISTLIHIPSGYEGSGVQEAHPSFAPPKLQDNPEIVLGNVVYRGDSYGVAGLSVDDMKRSVYTAGGSGTGKSVLLINEILQLFRRGNTTFVLDFHGDLSEDIIQALDDKEFERTFLFDPTQFLFSSNPFELPNNLEGYDRDVAMEKIIGQTTELIRRLYGGPQFFGPSAHRLCSDSLRLAYRHKKNLTYVDIYDILEGRGELAGKEEVKKFFMEIKRLPDERREAVKNKLSPIIQNPMLRSLFCQQSSVDFNELMKPSRLVIWRLPKGELSSFNMTLIASSIVTKLWFHIINRPRDKRNPIFLFIDEFQNVFSGGMTLIDTMLSEQRKFGLAQALSHQSVSQIPRETLSTVLSNCGVKILFRESSDGSRVLARNLAPLEYQKVTDALSNLPDGMALVSRRSTFGEETTPLFQIATLPPPEKKNNDISQVIERMKERFEVPVVPLRMTTEAEPTPDVIDLLKIVHELEEKDEEATVGHTLDEFRKVIPHMKGSKLTSICDITESSGLIKRNVVKQARGRPKIIISLTEKGRKEIGFGVEMGGRKGGGDLHRTVILRLAEKLRVEGYHVEVPRQASTSMQPDLLTYRRSETGGWKDETAWEVETNPGKHPEQVKKNMMKAINAGREIVFVVLDEKGKEKLKEVLGKHGKGIKIGVFDFDKDFLDI